LRPAMLDNIGIGRYCTNSLREKKNKNRYYLLRSGTT
jgi:hypothetical protein